MPCRDGREDEDERDNDHMREGAELLCASLRECEAAHKCVPPQFAEWWRKHKERDRVREERGW